MTEKLTLIPVAPIGRETLPCFGQYDDGTPFYEIEQDVYPDEGLGGDLRDERIRLGLGLRAAAPRLGLSPVELGALERGRYTCDWGRALEMLRGESAWTTDRPTEPGWYWIRIGSFEDDCVNVRRRHDGRLYIGGCPLVDYARGDETALGELLQWQPARPKL